MKFSQPLIPGRLVRRYKRFFADVTLEDGTEVTAHCANTGAMTGIKEPGLKVWLSRSDNPKRKLKYTWELVEAEGTIIGALPNTANALAEEAVNAGVIAELAGHDSLRREVKYGENSRIDLDFRVSISICIDVEGYAGCVCRNKRNVPISRSGRNCDFVRSINSNHVGRVDVNSASRGINVNSCCASTCRSES